MASFARRATSGGTHKMKLNNTTAADYLQSSKDARYTQLIAKLGKMEAAQIKSELAKMHDEARSLPKRDAWESDQLHIMANAAANHYFLIMNPEMAHGENLEHAIKRGFPIPQMA